MSTINSSMTGEERTLAITKNSFDTDIHLRTIVRGKNPVNIMVSHADLVRALKDAGITAEDFREPTFQEQFAELPVDTVFVMIGRIEQDPEPRFIKHSEDRFFKSGDKMAYAPGPVMSNYRIKVISKPVEN